MKTLFIIDIDGTVAHAGKRFREAGPEPSRNDPAVYAVWVNFEEALLADTREYYARKSQEWIETDSTPAYLIKAEKALEEEKARVANYLNSETEEKLLKVVIEELLEKQESTLLERYAVS